MHKIGVCQYHKIHKCSRTDGIRSKQRIKLEVEADTGANISVAKAEILQEMDWIELEPTNVHIKGYSGMAEPCVGKAKVSFPRGANSHE